MCVYKQDGRAEEHQNRFHASVQSNRTFGKCSYLKTAHTFQGGKDNHNITSSNVCDHTKRSTCISAGWHTSLFSLGGVREAVKIHLTLYRCLRLVIRGKDYCEMHCYRDFVNYLSCGMILAGLWHLVHHRTTQTSYGRHMRLSSPARTVPARLAWFLQEMPALLIPLLLMLTSHKPSSMGKYLLLGTFCMHYFHR